ncbi:MAG: MmgE/PrpD family protein, partial [Rhodospirillales bacterium]|nr:MmgE/PrpD family protein [Rhodospirillales bacterium]
GRMRSALGLGAAHGSGFRGTHGSMAGHVVPAIGARGGTFAALLAAQGFECSADALESERGFVAEFSTGADLDRAITGLGTAFELLANAYKPYPSGIVVHPTIDACREIAKRRDRAIPITRVRLSLHPLGLALADRVAPGNEIDAQISQQHWAAAVLLGHRPGPDVLRPACLSDDAVARLRPLIELAGDEALARDEAIAEVWSGTAMKPLRAHIPHARGSLARPMTDAELDRKFLDQAEPILGPDRAARLLCACRDLASADDVGATLAACMRA